MLESIGAVLDNKKAKEKEPLQEHDAKVIIERWLQDHLSVESVYCVAVSGTDATVRVGSPVIHQEVRLQEYDLKQMLAQTLGYTLNTITIIASY